MVTYLMRHGSTAYSEFHQVNGNSDVDVPLNTAGVRQCQAARSAIPTAELSGCLVSRFARTAQSARLVLGDEGAEIEVLPDLDELDFGAFEGADFLDYAVWLSGNGPWLPAPQSAESQRQAIARMVRGLRTALSRPGPRLVVTHGLIVSVVQWARSHTELDMLDDVLFFPEAPCAEPLRIEDDELTAVLDRLMRDQVCQNQAWRQSGLSRADLLDAFAAGSTKLREISPPVEEGSSDA